MSYSLSSRIKGIPWMVPAIIGLSMGSVGCSSSDAEDPGPAPGAVTNEDGDSELSDVDALLDGAPTNDMLADEGKADAVYPAEFNDLVEVQSRVLSQGRRGVCSIFSTVGLMEHLYIKEGTITEPDFSEQALQWSTKIELGAFPRTGGSSASRNLEAINRFGLWEEAAWPYEPNKWTTANDPECTGEDDQPTLCYTNGSPPETALTQKRWYLPRGRWVSSRVRSLKAVMFEKKMAVVAGMTFYYQSWNHRGSKLKTDNELWRKGIVTYPNQDDKTSSLEKRAGHSILLVGWDDNMEAPKRDKDGEYLKDADGNVEMEKGFFLFKNSWGTGSFGKDNPNGDGYGWLSYKYVEEEARSYISGVPEVEIPAEACNDEVDNDRDGDVDCDDADCADDAACQGDSLNYTNDTPVSIPDNDPAGATSTIEVPDGGKVQALSLTVDISHSYKGDLTVSLVSPTGTEHIVHDGTGSSDDDVKGTFTINAFLGEDAAGTWTLKVVDSANADTGTINSFGLSITRCSGDDCGTSGTKYESTESASIPDNDPVGASTDITVADGDSIMGMIVNVDITHPAKGDITVKLQKIGEGEATLIEADASDGPFAPRTFTISDFDGSDPAGTWRLVVSDVLQGDAGGLLNAWSIEFQ